LRVQVNLEGFVLYNAAMNALLLFCTGRLSGLRAKMWRLALAAALGAAYAVASNLAPLRFLQAWYGKLACACAMAALAFLPNRPRKVLRAAACFFLAAMLLGGTGFSLLYLLGARGYGWNIALLVAILGAAGGVVLATAGRRARFDKILYDVRIRHGDTEARFTAMLDTGNRLVEPLSGLPVIVVQKEALKGIVLPEGNPVTYASMAGDGELSAFEPDSVLIDGKEGCRVAVAAYEGALSTDGRYAALLPLEAIESSDKERRLAC
jgi:stage II sporulation protein GA (sporulation sigma-E factor processing peptidase)